MINDEKLECVEVVNFIGIQIDSNLSFNEHKKGWQMVYQRLYYVVIR